ncbi:MAG: hypothetical protein L0Y61_07870 [Epsilonproteobacteria bacterium]|nr:hypothetical protein [Campylobacterota bacterium]
MENKFISADELKSLYFKDESKLFSKTTKKQDFHIKSTTEILSSISSNGSFKKVKDTYRLNLILSKILLKSQMNWVNYSYYKDKKLFLGAAGHIGQSELNMQKYLLMENLKKIERYSDIEGISIYRDENRSQNIETQTMKISMTPEKSYGIFDNYLEDKVLYDIVERIKLRIRNNNL